MRHLSDTINRLSRLKGQPVDRSHGSGPLKPLGAFGSNPGALNASYFIPAAGLVDGASLVLVLHGCNQTAASYDGGSGWSSLAEKHRFALVFAEQQAANNPNGCFSWFNPADTGRDLGEALSIRQMVAHMLDLHPSLDRSRVFVTGLSAGGAMTAVMLATYPEVFAGGAIIAGLPFSTAASIPQAFDRMRGHGGPSDATELGRLVLEASPHAGPWPTLSVWHGDVDHVVVPSNAETLLTQWRAVHDLADTPSRIEAVGVHRRRVWLDRAGREAIEAYEISGMGHGVPLDSAIVNGPYMFDMGISSTHRIAAFWGIAPDVSDLAPREERPHIVMAPAARMKHQTHADGQSEKFALSGVKDTIERALRSAGLMR